MNGERLLKIAGAQAEVYKLLKPIVLKAENARSTRELADIASKAMDRVMHVPGKSAKFQHKYLDATENGLLSLDRSKSIGSEMMPGRRSLNLLISGENIGTKV